MGRRPASLLWSRLGGATYVTPILSLICFSYLPSLYFVMASVSPPVSSLCLLAWGLASARQHGLLLFYSFKIPFSLFLVFVLFCPACLDIWHATSSTSILVHLLYTWSGSFTCTQYGLLCSHGIFVAVLGISAGSMLQLGFPWEPIIMIIVPDRGLIWNSPIVSRCFFYHVVPLSCISYCSLWVYMSYNFLLCIFEWMFLSSSYCDPRLCLFKSTDKWQTKTWNWKTHTQSGMSATHFISSASAKQHLLTTFFPFLSF